MKVLLPLSAVLALVFLALPLVAQDFEGRTIRQLTYEPAAQPLDSRDLAALTKLAAGKPFQAADAAETIDGLFATRRYADIRIDAEPAEANQIDIRIITEPAWFVGHVAIEGKVKNPPNAPQLADATRLDLGSVFADDDLDRAVRGMRALLERNGFYGSGIRVETQDQPGIQQRDIRFIFDLGKRAKYTQPQIQGDPKLSDAAVLRATGWQWRFIHLWRGVTQERTRKGIAGVLKRYQKEDRLTADVRAGDPQFNPQTNRLEYTLDIDAGPKVEIHSIETEVSRRTLKKYVPVFEELTVTRDLLVEGARNLRAYFQQQGYYEATVEFRQRQDDPDHLVIEYVINRGKRYKLVEVKIQGNEYFSTSDLRERMFLQPSSFRARRGRFSEAFLDRDEDTIRNLYRSNGFQDVDVSATVDSNYGGQDGDVAVTLQIDQGPQYLVDHLEIEGLEHVSRDRIEGLLTASEGQPYSEVSIAADRNAILTEYQIEGFPEASFRWRSEPSGTRHRVNLYYSIAEGPQRFVRDVVVSGVSTTRRSLVDRYLRLKPGEPLSIVQMSNIQRDLYQLGVFSRIDTAIQNPDGDATYKRVLFDFQEASRYSLAVGVGAEVARIGGTSSDLSTPAGATGFSPRLSVDVSRLNLWGLGHTATLRGRISNLEQLSSFNYVAPRFQNKEGRNLSFTALYQVSRDVRTFSSRRAEASIQVSQQVSKASNVLVRLSYRRVSVGDLVIPALLVPQLLQPVRIGMISTIWVTDRRDNPADAHRGIYNTLDLGVATRYLGSQRSFVRGLFRNATYTPVTRNVIFARETSFGMILPFAVPAGTNSADAIPLPERFFGGGNASHRGFPENQAGPRDIGNPNVPADQSQATGFPLGGNILFFNNSELRFPLIGENLGAVLFHDFGNIFDSISDFSFRVKQPDIRNFNYMVHAVGAGIRYRTPVGPVRVDLAYSINPPEFLGFKGTVQDLLQCGAGSTLPQCQTVQNQISHFQFFFSIGQTF